MKRILFVVAMMIAMFSLISCEKDEGKLPNISFKTGGSYISADASLALGSSFTIGIDASKSEKKDVLKQFNISKSVNGAANESIFDKSLSGGEGDNFSYDFNGTVDSPEGLATKYTFTVTNRDGLTNQVSLTVTTE